MTYINQEQRDRISVILWDYSIRYKDEHGLKHKEKMDLVERILATTPPTRDQPILRVRDQVCLKCGCGIDIEPSISYSYINHADVDVEFSIGCECCGFEVTVYKKVSFSNQDMLDAEV